MSARLLILPRLQAMACGTYGPAPTQGNVARTVHLLKQHEPAQPFLPGRRKGPHSLKLVQARAAGPAPANAPRALPVRPQPQLAFYRKYTEAMLRRYLKLSMEAGRVPSLIGQDMFRGNVSHCSVSGFDDVVIFVEDINKCLLKLSAGEQYLVRKIAIEGYTQGETAALGGIPLRSVIRRYTEAIDRLTRLFLDRNLLKEMGDPDLEG